LRVFQAQNLIDAPHFLGVIITREKTLPFNLGDIFLFITQFDLFLSQLLSASSSQPRTRVYLVETKDVEGHHGDAGGGGGAGGEGGAGGASQQDFRIVKQSGSLRPPYKSVVLLCENKAGLNLHTYDARI
jgi:hypothetical protein